MPISPFPRPPRTATVRLMTEIGTAPARVGVPFLDLGRSHAPLKAAILEDIAALIDSSAFTNGAAVGSFEEAFASWCGISECVGLASGLDALRLGLLAAGIEPGDEVLVPAMTFVATFEAVTQAGGVPVPVDASELDWNMDPAAAEAAHDGADTLPAARAPVRPAQRHGAVARPR